MNSYPVLGVHLHYLLLPLPQPLTQRQRTDSKWQSWDLKPGRLTSRPAFTIFCLLISRNCHYFVGNNFTQHPGLRSANGGAGINMRIGPFSDPHPRVLRVHERGWSGVPGALWPQPKCSWSSEHPREQRLASLFHLKSHKLCPLPRPQEN